MDQQIARLPSEGAVRRLPLEHEALFQACAARLSVALRPTARGGSPLELSERLRAEGATVFRIMGNVLEAHFEGPLAELPSIKEGRAVVQDAVAAEVGPFLSPEPGERVLDLCAAPGGKTLHLAELMKDEGEVVAAHLGDQRAERLRDNVRRLGLRSVKLVDLGPAGDAVPRCSVRPC